MPLAELYNCCNLCAILAMPIFTLKNACNACLCAQAGAVGVSSGALVDRVCLCWHSAMVLMSAETTVMSLDVVSLGLWP